MRIPIVSTVASRGTGIDTLRATLLEPSNDARELPLPAAAEVEVNGIAEVLATQYATARRLARAVALRLLVSPDGDVLAGRRFGEPLAQMVGSARERMAARGAVAELRGDGAVRLAAGGGRRRESTTD